MNLNNYVESRRNFFKVFASSLISFKFYFLLKKNPKKTIITKKIGDENWILSSEDF